MTSPVTTEWQSLPDDIRSAAETAVGHLRPLTHAETLLIVGRAIKAERERDGWQPIETAPKEGEILIYSKYYGVLIASWNCGKWDDGEGRPDRDDVTHWQPLPAAPEIKERIE